MLKFKSFGKLNSDIRFIVIKQETQGRGLFSLLSSVICWIDFAEKNNLIPVVDFKNYKNTYNEYDPVYGTLNSFEYYFKPLNHYSLEEVYNSQNVCFSGDSFPDKYNFTITGNKDLYNIYNKYFFLTDHVQDCLKQNVFLNLNILGVHYRGKEMRRAGGHIYPPTLNQMKFAINKALSISSYDKIFVSSEDLSLIRSLQKEYPGMIIYNTNYFRTNYRNSYNIYPRKFHKFKLGREVLLDMFILSECKSFVFGSSNVAAFARFINNNNYIETINISNPYNFSRYKLYLISWYIKRLFPPFFKGFKLDESTIKLSSKGDIAKF